MTLKEVPFAPSTHIVERLLLALAPLRPSFVYERLSTRTRGPERAYIGIGREEKGENSSEGFDALRAFVAQPTSGPSAARTALAFFSYEALTGATPADSAFFTPRSLLVQPAQLIELDFFSGRARLTGFSDVSDALVRALTEPEPESASQASPPADEALGEWRADPDERAFIETVDRLKIDLAQRSDVVGVALSAQVERKAEFDALDAYLALRRLNPSTCMFFLEDRDFSLLGATSLPVLRIKGRQITAETDGATRRARAGADDVWTPTAKENEEYDLVVAALRKDLSELVDPASLAFMADREPRQYFNLRHLFAEISADLRDGVDAIDALQALTPHGAATGFDKRGAVQLIDKYDLKPRGPYAGAIGVFSNDGSADAACVIRSAWKVGNLVRTRAGAKIVAASDSAAEYAESILKTLPLRRAVAQAMRNRG